jgi:DNA-binding response OmpR family regulator
MRAQRGPILLVDDEPYMLRWLAHVLTRAGYRVATAGDGAAGLARARELHPALIFLDLHMPRLDGGAVCAAVRGDPTLAGTHVILMSASPAPAPDACEWRDGRPDEYLAKPCRPREVLRRVAAVLAGPPHHAVAA